MKKRDAIIISVLVNAGLLIILFISAITTHDQPKQALSPDMVSAISEPMDNPIASLSEPVVEPVQEIVAMQSAAIAREEIVPEEPIVHKLPPLEEKQKGMAVLPPTNSYKEVVVKKGDTLEKIARFHHTSIAEIERINHLASHMLRINQVLLVPKNAQKPSQPVVVSPKEAEAEYYTVKVGDNPWTIAMKHNMKVSDLMRINNLNKEKAKKIRPGMKLRIR